MPADVVVAGGGPAGLAVAIGAVRRGLEVTVLDRRKPPIDVACGEGIMPDGVARLAALGMPLDDVPSRPFVGIRYLDGALTADGRFPDAPGVGIRRTELHRAMVATAERVGVDLRWGVTVRGLRDDGLDTDRGAVSARWVVGADGRGSSVRRWAGLAGGRGGVPRFGVRRHVALAPWSDRVEVHWADDAEAYVTPVGPEEVGIALLWSGQRGGFDTLLERFPVLAERIRGAPPTSRDRGAGPLAQRARSVTRGPLALVGDAAGSMDAITGEGIALALAEADALAEAMAAGDLGNYRRAHRAIVGPPRRLTALVLLLHGRPGLRRLVMRRLAAAPGLMSRFLEVKQRPRLLGRHGLVRLTWAAVAGVR